MTDRSPPHRRENALAGRIRRQILRCLRNARVPYDVAEDLAQDLLVELVERITRGHVAPGAEHGYVRAAAMNRARDWFRRESGVFQRARALAVDADEVASNDVDAEAMLVLEEEAREGLERVVAVRAELARAPERYRYVLSAVYLDGVPIDSLVQRELPRGAAPADLKRARDRVDKHLERARKWLRARVACAPQGWLAAR